MTRRQRQEQVRRADALLRGVAVDALEKTAVLLLLIAEGRGDPLRRRDGRRRFGAGSRRDAAL
jgi:hypothetical protein